MLIIKSLKKTLKVSQFSRTCQLFNENLWFLPQRRGKPET
jgi:hypothetical protein